MCVGCTDYCMSVLYLWLVLTSRGFRFPTAHRIRYPQWQWQDKAACPSLSSKYLHSINLCMETLVIKWCCRTLHFLGAVCPGARTNGLLTPRQALGLQVVSHCQAALINSYNSWRDKRQTVTHWRPYKWKCNRLTNTFTGQSALSNYSFFVSFLFGHKFLHIQTDILYFCVCSKCVFYIGSDGRCFKNVPSLSTIILEILYYLIIIIDVL